MTHDGGAFDKGEEHLLPIAMNDATAILDQPNGLAAQRRAHLGLALLLLLTLLDGLLWSAATPLWQGPDEDGHFAATQFVAEHLRLPGHADGFRADELALAADLADTGKLHNHPELRQAFSDGQTGPHEAELRALDPATRTSYAIGAPGKLNHTSPLYYVLGAGIYRLAYGADLQGRVFAVRLFSVALTTLMVLVSYFLTVEVLLGRRDVALIVAVVISFQPMLSFVGSVVNNDILLNLIATTAIWVLVRTWRRGVTARQAVALGLALGLGMLAKPLIAGLALPVAWVFVREWWQRRGERRRVVLLGLLALAVALALCGWWLVRSFDLNDGELYMNEVKKGYRVIAQPRFDYRGHPWRHAVDYYASIVGGVWSSYWAAFGWLDTPAAPAYYRLVDAVTLLGVLGLAVYVCRLVRRRAWPQLGVTGLLVALVLSPVAMMHVYDYTYWIEYGVGRGLQGRYFFGQMAPLFILLVIGLLTLLPRRWHGAGHLALRIGIVTANFYCLLWAFLPRYYL
jgi:4-amino-4-deoxy-L-arabinose transferase-like glycosyltransferase